MKIDPAPTPHSFENCADALLLVMANVHFISGSTAMWLVYLFLVLLMAGVGILLLMALLENLSSVTRAAGALMALALLGPGIWRMRRQGQGAAFDPENPPVSLLGE